jgi:D-sedoheptulose 7-phosphate isomerase
LGVAAVAQDRCTRIAASRAPAPSGILTIQGGSMSRQGRAIPRTRTVDPATPVVSGHLSRLQQCLKDLPADQVAAVAERIWDVARSGGQIITGGNGGSAATASHMALDLGKSTLGGNAHPSALRIRTFALNDPVPVITAWANDYGYDRVFAEQIRTLAGPGDTAVFFSVSGNSPNVVAAARAAHSAGTTVIGVLGRPGGAMRELTDLAIIVPSEDYQIVEDVHLAISHIVTRYVMQMMESAASTGGGRSGKRQSRTGSRQARGGVRPRAVRASNS